MSQLSQSKNSIPAASVSAALLWRVLATRAHAADQLPKYSQGDFVCGTLLIIVLTFLLIGCSPRVEAGKPFTLPADKKDVVFAASAISHATMTNQDGTPIPEIIIHEASLLLSPEDLANSKHKFYVVFWDSSLGGLMESRYWQQQSENRAKLGLPVMTVWSAPVPIVSVDSKRVVRRSTNVRIAHAQLSVDTNDFGRLFVP